jgi:hypothetical protein
MDCPTICLAWMVYFCIVLQLVHMRHPTVHTCICPALQMQQQPLMRLPFGPNEEFVIEAIVSDTESTNQFQIKSRDAHGIYHGKFTIVESKPTLMTGTAFQPL